MVGGFRRGYGLALHHLDLADMGLVDEDVVDADAGHVQRECRLGLIGKDGKIGYGRTFLV